MRSLNYPFEQINTEQLIKRIYSYVSTIDSSLPANDVSILSGQTQPFSVTPQLPFTHTLQVKWYVDNILQSATSTSFNLNTTGLSLGTHTVRAEVKIKQVGYDPIRSNC